MRKIAIIGAGSVVFCKTLVLDIMQVSALRDAEFVLMAPSTRNTSQAEAYFKKIIEKENLPARVRITTDRLDALEGADYVVLTFQIGGTSAYEADCEIPLKYGVASCIGDTLGPGGVFRALRTIPVVRAVCADVRAVCPDALILNYVNPMAMIGWALGREGVKFVGLCHGVQTTLDLIAGYCGVKKEDVDFLCAGINHMGWFLRVETGGEDLYPRFRAILENPGHYVNEKVRAEVLRHFGYFCTESTGHLSEYLPYFRKNDRALGLYCDEPGFGGETNANLKFTRHVQEKYGGRLLENEPVALPPRSVEYCSYILEAVETGTPFRFNGNVINGGMIENLPADCCAEGPLYADRMGIHRTVVGELPPQLAALNLTNISVQRLAVRAAYSGDPEHIVHALALDPLTAAVLTLTEIREMASEMLEAQRAWLPQFAGKCVAPRPIISIPANVKRASAPVDPALAIMARFGELGR